MRFDSGVAVMRLLKRHTDETEADRAETDVPVVEEAAVDTEPAVETDADEPAVEEAAIDTEAVKTEPGDTDTDEPVDEPTAIVPARSVGRASTWSRMSLGPLLAIVAGAAFVAFGCKDPGHDAAPVIERLGSSQDQCAHRWIPPILKTAAAFFGAELDRQRKK